MSECVIDDYEYLMTIHLERNLVTRITGIKEEIVLHFSLNENSYHVYNNENKLLSEIDISLRYVWNNNLSSLISIETKKLR